MSDKSNTESSKFWHTFTTKFIGTPPESDLNHVEENAGRYSLGFGTQNIGDQIVSAKTVLPWFLSVVAAPAWIIPLLVPIRESGSMLPQALFRPWLQTKTSRLGFMLIGTLGQALACAIMVAAALLTDGLLAGLIILFALALLSTCRSLVSLTSKDIAGRTVPKGFRGRLTGFATTLSGAVAILVGVAIQAARGELTPSLFAVLFAVATAAWLASAWLFKGIREGVTKQEEKDLPQGTNYLRDVFDDIVDLVRSDRDFRRFVLVRSLLLASALSPTFLVTMANQQSATEESSLASAIFTGLGTFVIASGVASLLAGRVSGWLSDVSSRNTLSGAALLATVVLIITVALGYASSLSDAHTWTTALVWWLPIAFFIISLAHAAIRVARSTYIVDMAEGTQRTRYVSVANTLMGVLLLLVGALTSALALVSPEVALAALALFGLLGAALSKTLPEVSVGKNKIS
ncbi:MFS transporter [uncultured Corynebacterium sp.]|uniref:MFS transporter n=1 Tax=uncultured Corynebacterium sp. TaxID=159447 RepID=UPI0025E35DFC|nr:MFS transporter [uncultured Corynebacterium sp.]